MSEVVKQRGNQAPRQEAVSIPEEVSRRLAELGVVISNQFLSQGRFAIVGFGCQIGLRDIIDLLRRQIFSRLRS